MGGFPIDASGFMGQVVLRQHYRGGAEGIGFQNVGAGFQVSLVNIGNDLRKGQIKVFITAFELGAAKVIGPQVPVLNCGAHSAVNYQYSFLQQRLQLINAVNIVHISHKDLMDSAYGVQTQAYPLRWMLSN